MRIREIPSNGELFPTIALPDEDIPTPKLRHFITIIICGLVCLIGWLWWRVWQIVTTPLAQQPELMIPVNTRLARRETVEV